MTFHRGLAVAGLAVLSIATLAPARADDVRGGPPHGDSGRVITVVGTAQYASSGSCANGGSPVTGTANGPGLRGSFSACVLLTNDPNTQCRREDFTVVLTDSDRQHSTVSASGVGTGCFGANNPPFYGAFRIDAATGRFKGAVGLPGLLSVQINPTAPNSTTLNFVATVVNP